MNSESVNCPFCDKKFSSKTSLLVRQSHVENCKDEHENALIQAALRKSTRNKSKQKTSTTSATKTTEKNLANSNETEPEIGLKCPFCTELFINAEKLRAHVKRCAKKKNIDSIEAIRMLRAISDSLGKENIEMLMQQFEGQKLSVKRKRKPPVKNVDVIASSDSDNVMIIELGCAEKSARKSVRKTNPKKRRSHEKESSEDEISKNPISKKSSSEKSSSKKSNTSNKSNSIKKQVTFTPDDKLSSIISRNELFRILSTVD